jgi:hypothetical protein
MLAILLPYRHESGNAMSFLAPSGRLDLGVMIGPGSFKLVRQLLHWFNPFRSPGNPPGGSSSTSTHNKKPLLHRFSP